MLIRMFAFYSTIGDFTDTKDNSLGYSLSNGHHEDYPENLDMAI